jgi:DNA-directed RNA polymerase subunit E'/Rpb7
MPADDLELVPVCGRVHVVTAFGLFLDVQGRRLFVPYALLPNDGKFKRDQKVKLRLMRGYLQQHGIIG